MPGAAVSHGEGSTTAPFENLFITSLLRDRCFPVQGPIVRVYLQLSRPPPLGWPSMFTVAWQNISYPEKRPAGVEGDSLWIECIPGEVMTLHIEHLAQGVAEANASHRLTLRDQAMEQIKQMELNTMIAAQLDDLGAVLNQNSGRPRTFWGMIRSFFSAIASGFREFKRAFQRPGRRRW
jgi:hypothetical protein